MDNRLQSAPFDSGRDCFLLEVVEGAGSGDTGAGAGAGGGWSAGVHWGRLEHE